MTPLLSDLIVRGTIWIALGLFVAGEAGRRVARSRGRPTPWALAAFALGAACCALHFAAAFHWHHAWSHARAADETARQMAEVFGVGWSGSLWFNYLFLAAWIGDAMAWAWNPQAAARPPSAAMWLLRGFYLLMIVNGTVVFVPWPTRLAGIVLSGLLLWTYRR